MEDQGAQGGRSISCCGRSHGGSDRYDAASLDNPNVIAAAQQGIAHEPASVAQGEWLRTPVRLRRRRPLPGACLPPRLVRSLWLGCDAT
jgi:hypothetical protein